MQRKRAGLLVMLAQILLVLTIAGKYAYERIACPRVWTRAGMYDPETLLRGRYLAMQVEVNACALPWDGGEAVTSYDGPKETITGRAWTVRRLVSDGGHLAARDAVKDRSSSTDLRVELANAETCEHATLRNPIEQFVPEHAASPFPSGDNNTLWVEVTIPPKGEPRPIQLHVWPGKPFHPMATGRFFGRM